MKVLQSKDFQGRKKSFVMRTSATTLVRKYKGREKVEQLEIGLKEKGRKDTRKMCSEGRRKKKNLKQDQEEEANLWKQQKRNVL